MAGRTPRALSRRALPILLQERLPRGAPRVLALRRAGSRRGCGGRAAARRHAARRRERRAALASTNPAGNRDTRVSAETYTLGINAAYHDSAACLVRGG